MNIKNLKLKNLVIILIICLAYPIAKAYKANNHLLVFSDTCTIISLVMIIVGIFNSFVLHGDFDITSFIAYRTFNRDGKDFDAYKKDQDSIRKDSFNYPLFVAILLFIIAYIVGLFA